MSFQMPKREVMCLQNINYNADAIPQKMDDPVFSYDFESLETGDVTSIKDCILVRPEELNGR